MIDLGLLRESPQEIIKRLREKEPSFDGQLLHDLDKQVRVVRLAVEQLLAQKNELAKGARGGVSEEIREQSKKVSAELKVKEIELTALEKKFTELYLTCPNLPMPDAPIGGKPENKVIKVVGEQPTFNFPVKHHLDLGQALGWLDFDTATKLAGSNFPLYKGEVVSLLYGLAFFMLKSNKEHGFSPVLPAVLVNETALQTAGNFPKFKDQVYALPADGLYLSPTSEVNLTNMYREHIFAQEELPVRMTAWTSCFRREAGTYGAHERGLIRIHQFEKVELVSICEPEKSSQELDRMLACAESIIQKLGLHYRISLLATQDMSFQAAKTYDIEVWLPGQKQYYEVSSASNCTDFQARRGLIRYRQPGDKRTHLVHTLNASSLALPRLMVAIMETYQQADGSIAIPDVLRSSMII